jgi:glycosyltransferase involved in cell wall biosynthesis
MTVIEPKPRIAVPDGTPPAGAGNADGPSGPNRRLVIVVRADPVICGHSGEARNLAEAALLRGFDDVRIITWPIEALTELPLKPLDSVLPYSPGITVERPEPVGDFKVPDGRYLAGMVGRLVELFTEGMPTVCMSLYLTPHANVVIDALQVIEQLGLEADVTTIAEAVGSDITNIVRSCVDEGRIGAAAQVFSTYLANDHCVAVSEYTKTVILAAAREVDERLGTNLEAQCRRRVRISYPAIDSRAFIDVDQAAVDQALAARGLSRDGYALFLSRITPAKGVDDLIDGYVRSRSFDRVKLVIAGNGSAVESLKQRAAELGAADRITFLNDVDDVEKRLLMAGCATYVLASKPKPEFVETFGIALVEKMLSGGGPIITTATGGIPEAVGDTAHIVPVESPDAIAQALDLAVLETSPAQRASAAEAARAYAMQFDRMEVFDRLFSPLVDTSSPAAAAI